MAGDDFDIAPGLFRQTTARCQPILHPLRTGIVGRRRKPKIAEAICRLTRPECSA